MIKCNIWFLCIRMSNVSCSTSGVAGSWDSARTTNGLPSKKDTRPQPASS